MIQHTKSERIFFAMLAFAFSILVVTSLIAMIPARVESSSDAKKNSSGQLNLSLQPFASGLNDPVGMANAGDERLFVLEREGIIRIVRPDGNVEATPYLSITTSVGSSHPETGLLGLAFDPNYAVNGYFYINYTSPITTSDFGFSGHTRISRFQVTNNPDIAEPNSEEILITAGKPLPVHSGGSIRFGPDGYLYIPLGNGGFGSQPFGSESMRTLHGKVSRIDVSTGALTSSRVGNSSECAGIGTGNYTIPDDNPFADGAGGPCDEIWALGLRNPWQSSFDRQTGDFYIGDVGLFEWEEINFQPASSGGGEHYGWRCFEGNHPYEISGCGPIDNYKFPVFEYSHESLDCAAVIGGFVYRGDKYPAMRGHYLLTDYCAGYIWDLIPDCGTDWAWVRHDNEQRFGYSAFGEGYDGELYLANNVDGIIYSVAGNANAPPAPLNYSIFLPIVPKPTCG